MKQDRTLKAVSITLENVTAQLNILDDFISEVCEQHPEQETYKRLFDYVWSSVQDVQEKIKTLY